MSSFLITQLKKQDKKTELRAGRRGPASFSTWHLSGFGSQSTQAGRAWQHRQRGGQTAGRRDGSTRGCSLSPCRPLRGAGFGRGSTVELWWDSALRTLLQHPPPSRAGGLFQNPCAGFPEQLLHQSFFPKSSCTLDSMPQGGRMMSLQRWLGAHLQHPRAVVPC